MRARIACLFAVMIFAAAPTVGAAEDERITLFDLVTAAPLPAGYEAKLKDFRNPDGTGSTLILLTTPANKSRIQVTIEKERLLTKDQKVAAYKNYANGIQAVFLKRGYRMIETEHPDSRTLDPAKRLDLRLKMQKEDKFLFIDADIFFTSQGYTVWSVTDDITERDVLKKWSMTVRPK